MGPTVKSTGCSWGDPAASSDSGDLGFLNDTVFKSMLRLRDEIVDLKVTNEHVIEYYQGRGAKRSTGS